MSLKGTRALMKNKKALSEIMDLGRQYDKETDPVKKEALKNEIETKCAALKGKLSPFVKTTPPTPNEEAPENQL